MGELYRFSLGPETEAFVTALADVYEVRKRKFKLKSFSLVALLAGKTTPSEIASDSVTIQAIHGAMPSDGYVKLFLHIDVPRRLVHIVEADKRYRKATARLFFTGDD